MLELLATALSRDILWYSLFLVSLNPPMLVVDRCNGCCKVGSPYSIERGKFADDNHSRQQHRPLLSQALERFHSELKDDSETIIDVENVEELLAQAKAMEPALSGRGRPSTFKRLESILPHINDFAAIIAVCSGADAKATGLVWGSLKVVFMVPSAASDSNGSTTNSSTRAVSISIKRDLERHCQHA